MRREALACLWLGACAPASHALPTAAVSTAPPSVSAPACPRGDRDANLGDLAARPSADIIAALGTGADGYQLQDGVWLAQASTLVNEDFDFATAMSLGAIGAGLAAKQRADHNRERADLASSRSLPADGRAALDALRACGIHRYAIDWGGPNPAFLVVTDVFDAAGTRRSSFQQRLDADARETWWSADVSAREAPSAPAP